MNSKPRKALEVAIKDSIDYIDGGLDIFIKELDSKYITVPNSNIYTDIKIY